MEVVSREIPYRWRDVFTLYAIGDCHLGVAHCDEDLLASVIDEVRRDPRALWIGMGDYADCITPSDFKRWDGKILAEWMRGHEDNIGPTQLDRVCELFSPIWNKCICLIEGNHEESIRRHNHYDFMAELLKRANQKHNVPYGGASCFVNLIFCRQNSNEHRSIIIHARHGEGSARTSGARALAVLRLSQTMVNAHITLMGHLHGQESPDIPTRLILSRNNKIKDFEAIAVMTGAFIRAYMQGVPPTYLERWGTPPSVLGCPRIIIKPETGEIRLEKIRKTREIAD